MRSRKGVLGSGDHGNGERDATRVQIASPRNKARTIGNCDRLQKRRWDSRLTAATMLTSSWRILRIMSNSSVTGFVSSSCVQVAHRTRKTHKTGQLSEESSRRVRGEEGRRRIERDTSQHLVELVHTRDELRLLLLEQRLLAGSLRKPKNRLKMDWHQQESQAQLD